MRNYALLLCLMLSGVPAWCSDLSTQVTGGLTFATFGSTNYFDPNNFFVPATGYGNSNTCGSPLCTISISPTTPTFGYEDSFNLLVADFSSGNQLRVTDTLLSKVAGTNGFTITFTDPVFFGAAKASDTFANGGLNLSFSGKTISLSLGLGSLSPTSSAVFNIATTSPVPEPSTYVAGLIGFAAIELVVRRRSSKTAVQG